MRKLKDGGERKGQKLQSEVLCILKNFAVDTKTHDSITVDYYTSALPTNIT